MGLLGGSFDPAHAGHAAITREALRRLGLARVWWLVSPGNPLKSEGPAPLDRRIERARATVRHPRVSVTGIEAEMGTRHTEATLRGLARAFPELRFVWLMGADNMVQIDRWQNWQDIFAQVPVAVFGRPGFRQAALRSRAARRFRAARLPERAARALACSAPPAWVFLDIPMSTHSSTDIRERGGWNRR